MAKKVQSIQKSSITIDETLKKHVDDVKIPTEITDKIPPEFIEKTGELMKDFQVDAFGMLGEVLEQFKIVADNSDANRDAIKIAGKQHVRLFTEMNFIKVQLREIKELLENAQGR